MSYEVLEKKNVFLTGASGGLGRAIAIELSKHKCNLFLTGQDEERLSNTAGKCTITTNKILYMAGDLTNEQQRKDIILFARGGFKHIDILINCASVFELKNLFEMSISNFDDIFNINVKVPLILIKEFSGDMVRNKWGRIVNIGSSSGYNGDADSTLYCMTKHALSGMSKSIYDVLKKDNVRVYDVLPGSIQTPMGKKDYRQDYNTFMRPEEVAEYISFIMKFDKEMLSREIKLVRTVI